MQHSHGMADTTQPAGGCSAVERCWGKGSVAYKLHPGHLQRTRAEHQSPQAFLSCREPRNCLFLAHPITLLAPEGAHQSAEQSSDFFFPPFLLILSISLEFWAEQNCWCIVRARTALIHCARAVVHADFIPHRCAFWRRDALLALHAFQAAWLVLRLVHGWVTTQMFSYREKILLYSIFSGVQNWGNSWVFHKKTACDTGI